MTEQPRDLASTFSDWSKPPERPNRGRMWTVVLVSVIASIVLVVGGAAVIVIVVNLNPEAYTAPQQTRRPAPTAPLVAEPAPTTTVPARPFTGDLRTLLLKPPAGADANYRPTKLGYPDGTVSVEQAAAYEYDDPKAGAALLKGDAYRQGASAEWYDPTTREDVRIVLYQFGSPDYAEYYLSHHVGYAVRTDKVGGGVIPGVPDGRYILGKPSSGSTQYWAVAYFKRQDIVAAIWYYTPAQAQPSKVEDLATRQFALLP